MFGANADRRIGTSAAGIYRPGLVNSSVSSVPFIELKVEYSISPTPKDGQGSTLLDSIVGQAAVAVGLIAGLRSCPLTTPAARHSSARPRSAQGAHGGAERSVRTDSPNPPKPRSDPGRAGDQECANPTPDRPGQRVISLPGLVLPAQDSALTCTRGHVWTHAILHGCSP
jgi:hypothetical protein